MEDWQQEYIHGTLVILPPYPIRAYFDRLRERYDPRSHAVSPSHISITPPLRIPLDDKTAQRISAVCAAHHTLRIALGPFKTFLPHPVIYCAVEPNDRIRQLREALMELGIFHGSSIPNFVSHLTVSEFGAQDAPGVNTILRELSPHNIPSGFDANEITMLRPDQFFKFHQERAFRLAEKQSLHNDGEASHGTKRQ